MGFGMVQIDGIILYILVAMSSISVTLLIVREIILRKFAKPILVYTKARKNHLPIVMTHAPHHQSEFVIPHENDFGMLEFRTSRVRGKHIMFNPKKDPQVVESLCGVPVYHHYLGYPEALVTEGVRAVDAIRDILTEDPNLKDYTDERLLFWILKDEHWDNVGTSASHIDDDAFQELCVIREFLKTYEIPSGNFTYPAMASLLCPTNSSSHVINLISKVQERAAKMSGGVDTLLKIIIVSAIAGAIVIGSIAVSSMIAG